MFDLQLCDLSMQQKSKMILYNIIDILTICCQFKKDYANSSHSHRSCSPCFCLKKNLKYLLLYHQTTEQILSTD